MQEFEIEYGDIKFIVLGEYTPEEKGSWESPCYPDNFEAHSILIQGQPIEYMLQDNVILEIEELILNKYFR